LKVYLASRFSRQKELRDIRDYLEFEKNYEVTSQWLDGESEDRTEAAIMDRDDVQRADAVIMFSDEYGSKQKGGGRHWELGYGYGLGKKCVVVGPMEIIFHWLPDISTVPYLEDAIAILKNG